MMKYKKEEINDQIVAKATEFGACLAGIVSVEALKESPSHLIYGKIGDYETVANKEGQIKPGEVTWPEGAKSAIIIAFGHPEEKPELDWWKSGSNGGTPGNRMLISISAQLSMWLEEEKGIKTIELAYHIEQGGILLKDTAVMAGLGCIGKNNMLVTPEFGPRVRLRAMLTDEVLPDTAPIDFDPCEDCDMPCIKACPQEAFKDKVYSKKEFGVEQLPGRTGTYSRHLCNKQMQLDMDNCEEITVEAQDEPGKLVRYCRACEWACPVGKTA